MESFLDKHSGELVIVMLCILLLGTLMVVVPQLLRAHMRKSEMAHQEHMKALENGLTLPLEDDRSRVAGRMALLVPMVVLISAGTVTCFLAAYRNQEQVFAVSLAVWVVAGVVSLAAITGGVALIGRLAQLQAGEKDEEDVPENPMV
jgi:Na+/melibiose symporter-like transporter